MDPLLSDFFDYVDEQHAGSDYASDPAEICRDLSIKLVTGSRHFAKYASRLADQDVIFAGGSDWASHELFSVAHEIAHILARRGGYDRAIRHYHASTPDIHRHVERVIDHAAGLLLMPRPALQAAQSEFGDGPRTIEQLARSSGVSTGAALRRWVWQDVDQSRAAFIVNRNYVEDVASCHARLPFVRWQRVPEIQLMHPEVQVISLGTGRTLGTIA